MNHHYSRQAEIDARTETRDELNSLTRHRAETIVNNFFRQLTCSEFYSINLFFVTSYRP